jgi:hypothetical protein
MNSDAVFYATVLALMALMFGHPMAAVFIFLIGVLLS